MVFKATIRAVSHEHTCTLLADALLANVVVKLYKFLEYTEYEDCVTSIVRMEAHLWYVFRFSTF